MVLLCLQLLLTFQIQQGSKPARELWMELHPDLQKHINQSKVRWVSLTFNVEGDELAASGEYEDERRNRTVGKTRANDSFIHRWDVKTLRASPRNPWILAPFSTTQLNKLSYVPDGKTLFAFPQENQIHDYYQKPNSQLNSNPLTTQKEGTWQRVFLGCWKLEQRVIGNLPLETSPETIFLGGTVVSRSTSYAATPTRLLELQSTIVPARNAGISGLIPESIQVKLKAVKLRTSTPWDKVEFADSGPFALVCTNTAAELYSLPGQAKSIGVIKDANDSITEMKLSQTAKTIVLSTNHRKVRVYQHDGTSLKLVREQEPGGTITSIAVSRTGNRYAVSTSQGLLEVFDADTGFSLCKVNMNHELLPILALTPKGKLLAAATHDGKVLVVELPENETATFAERNNNKKNILAFQKSDLMVANDVEVQVKWSPEVEPRTYYLARLTKEVALLRSEPDGKAVPYYANRLKFMQIVSRDGRSKWLVGEQTKTFQGPTLAVNETAPVPAGRLEWSAEQERHYLIINAMRCYQHGKQVFSTSNATKAPYLESIRQRAEYAKTKGWTDIAQLYLTMSESLEQYHIALSTYRNAVDAYKTRLSALAEAKREAADREMFDALSGLGMLMMGSMTTQRVTELSNNTLQIETFDLFPGMAELGIYHLASAGMQSHRIRELIQSTEKISDEKLRNELTDALRSIDRSEQTFVDRNQSAIKEKLNLPARPEMPKTPTIAWLEAQKRWERLPAERDNAWIVAEAAEVRVRLTTAKSKLSEFLYREGCSMIQALELIPLNPVYQSDRVAIAKRAVKFIVRSAELDCSNEWEWAWNTKSLTAVRILQELIKTGHTDNEGELDSLLISAKALAGMLVDAKNEAVLLMKRYPESSMVLLLNARLACIFGNKTIALDYLDTAICKLGYRDFNRLREMPELPREHPRFKLLTELHLQVKGNLGFLSSYVQVKNTGTYALEKLSFRLTFNGKRANAPILAPAEKFDVNAMIPSLQPGETFIIMAPREVKPVTLRVPNPRPTTGMDTRLIRWENGMLVAWIHGFGVKSFKLEYVSDGFMN